MRWPLALLFVFAFQAPSQNVGDRSVQRHDTPRPLRTASTEIQIPFSAFDRKDHVVSYLRQDDVHIYDDGTERQLTSLTSEDGSASILFVIDVSRSMKKVLPYVSTAIASILTDAADSDEFAVLEFSDDTNVTVDFTTRQEDVHSRIRQLTSVRRTSLVDATVEGLRKIRSGKHARKAIVIMTDGQDNYSRYKEQDAIRIATETDVRIYGIELYPPIGEGYIPKTVLESLADATGGRYFPTRNPKKLPDLVSKFDVHRFYRATFHLPAGEIDSKSHRIDLKLDRAARPGGMKVFWKRAYTVAAEH